MRFLPNEEWYDDLFENCKNRKEVEDAAVEMIRYRDKERYESESNAVTIAQGHAATIESLINQMY